MPKIFHSLIMVFAISAAMLGNVSAQTRDLAMEESNRKLVVDFYNQFFNQHDTVKAAESVAENYLPHNPLLPDGKRHLSIFSMVSSRVILTRRLKSFAAVQMEIWFSCMCISKSIPRIEDRPSSISSG